MSPNTLCLSDAHFLFVFVLFFSPKGGNYQSAICNKYIENKTIETTYKNGLGNKSYTLSPQYGRVEILNQNQPLHGGNETKSTWMWQQPFST